MDFRLISFDLDGTLVDTAGEIAEAANLALTSYGIAPRPLAEITKLIGAGTRELMLRLLARCLLEQPALANSVLPAQVLSSFDEQYALTTGTSAVPYSGCVEALTRLKAAGLRLACVTNKELRHARAVLAATRLEAYFDLTIGGDSLPERKPHASVLRRAAASIGVSTLHTAHVGDSAVDVQAARNAGVAAWVVPYGYNAGRPIAEACPDRIFPDLLHVADHVLAGRIAIA